MRLSHLLTPSGYSTRAGVNKKNYISVNQRLFYDFQAWKIDGYEDCNLSQYFGSNQDQKMLEYSRLRRGRELN